MSQSPFVFNVRHNHDTQKSYNTVDELLKNSNLYNQRILNTATQPLYTFFKQHVYLPRITKSLKLIRKKNI